ILSGGDGNDRLDGGADDDRLNGNDGNDSLNGSTGDDLLQGESGRDSLRGGDGNDQLFGGSNSDWLQGDSGNDLLNGGLSDRDTLIGGDIGDTLIGAPGENHGPPSDITLEVAALTEVLAAGSRIGRLVESDPDVGDTLTLTLASGGSDNDNTSFTIDGDELRTNTEIDFSSQSSYRIRVRATDRDGLFLERSLTISFTPNESPSDGPTIYALTVIDPSITPPDSSGSGGVYQSPSISGEGRFVAFGSYGNNLVPGDTNGWQDIFIRDRQTGSTERITGIDGQQTNGDSYPPMISGNGRYVVFMSQADNLVPNDRNRAPDIFVDDRQTGTRSRVNASATGGDPNAGSSSAFAISTSGRFVVFQSSATNLTADGMSGLFVRDLETGTTTRVNLTLSTAVYSLSISEDGTRISYVTSLGIYVHDRTQGTTTLIAATPSYEPNMSANGRFVVFSSDVNRTAPTDSDPTSGVFIHDLETGTTRRVSVAMNGQRANAFSDSPTVSADGRYVAFRSVASNLVPGDTNSKSDYFVRDMQTGTTTRVNVSTGGMQSTTEMRTTPQISANGQFVAFGHDSNSLVPGDQNNISDVFVRDLSAGTTELISIRDSSLPSRTSSGFSRDYGNLSLASDAGVAVYPRFATDLVPVSDQAGNDPTRAALYLRNYESSDATTELLLPDVISPWISGNGRFVTFFSNSRSLVPADTNGSRDLFLFDRTTEQFQIVDIRPDGRQIQNDVFRYVNSSPISADGRYVVFTGSDDRNGDADIFVRDIVTQRTTFLGQGAEPSISANGKFAVYTSQSRIIVHDLETGTSEVASLQNNGSPFSRTSSEGVLSADGQFVAFVVNGTIYVRDRWNSTTKVVGPGNSPSISDDGRLIAFA
ncbi:MAG TPA: hypothetical protein VK137_16575, partial [Planctomycetaceae bacterium]|nr:hypothetical protein [Planctomycetaceae bacterium]